MELHKEFTKTEIQNLVKGIKSKKKRHYDIPEELVMHPEIVKIERKIGLRRLSKRGFDIIRNCFFVEEEIGFKYESKKIVSSYYKTFSDYYDFINGDIYENACYYLYEFSQDEIERYSIQTNKMNFCAFDKAKSIKNYRLNFPNKAIMTCNPEEIKYEVTKYYNRFSQQFEVKQKWTNRDDEKINEYRHTFNYFCDFVRFLNGDLSNADLLFCDGLGNIKNLNAYNLDGAVLRSEIKDRLGIAYERKTTKVPALKQSEENELLPITEPLSPQNLCGDWKEANQYHKIYYISDIHVSHKISNANCRSAEDERYIIQKIVDCIRRDLKRWQELGSKKIILFDGDTASSFSHFEMFVKTLWSAILNEYNVVFTLGNHEYWDENGERIEEIVEKYRNLLNEYNMYLLHNNILYEQDFNIEEITQEELNAIGEKELSERFTKARLILFGGTGFAGYNKAFNADAGLYQTAIDRQHEIDETRRFEKLYKKVCKCLHGKRVVILTHMPLTDWCAEQKYENGFVYISGHTHRDFYYDDGDQRIYADNQVGYNQKSCKLKFLYLEDDYDIFETYEDGIYELEREDYQQFLIGKNIIAKFTREFKKLFMLKKNGVYMFVLQSARDTLSLLNGGKHEKLLYKDINYYYENMDGVVARINEPLNKYSALQKQVSSEIKAIGGSGHIHGAIVDIDWFNHIYVNPIDSKLTPYFALSMTRKWVYPTFRLLLKEKCPSEYNNYIKFIGEQPKASVNLPAIRNNREIRFSGETDIYKASRIINKMQKLNRGILCVWIDPEIKKIEN